MRESLSMDLKMNISRSSKHFKISNCNLKILKIKGNLNNQAYIEEIERKRQILISDQVKIDPKSLYFEDAADLKTIKYEKWQDKIFRSTKLINECANRIEQILYLLKQNGSLGETVVVKKLKKKKSKFALKINTKSVMSFERKSSVLTNESIRNSAPQSPLKGPHGKARQTERKHFYDNNNFSPGYSMKNKEAEESMNNSDFVYNEQTYSDQGKLIETKQIECFKGSEIFLMSMLGNILYRLNNDPALIKAFNSIGSISEEKEDNL